MSTIDLSDKKAVDELADRIAARLSRPEKLAMSVNEAAASLGLSPNTVREGLKTGEIPGLHIRGRWLVSVPGLLDKAKGAVK